MKMPQLIERDLILFASIAIMVVSALCGSIVFFGIGYGVFLCWTFGI